MTASPLGPAPEHATDARDVLVEAIRGSFEALEIAHDGAATHGVDELSAMAHVALEMLAERLDDVASLDDPGRLCRSVLALHRAMLGVHAELTTERLSSISAIAAALGRLRAYSGLPGLLGKASAECCAACGFSRAVVYSVDGRVLRIGGRFPDSGEAPVELIPIEDADVEAWSTGEMSTRLVRRGAAESSALARSGISAPFAVSIITGRERALAVLIAGCAGAQMPERGQMQALSAFVLGLGHLVEHELLFDRLRGQRDQLRQLAQATESVARELCDSQASLPALGYERAMEVAAAPVGPEPEQVLATLLSRREIEVLEAMTSGATNMQIADRLFISEQTVKSHVRRILKQLGASNRVEAVSRFYRLGTDRRP